MPLHPGAGPHGFRHPRALSASFGSWLCWRSSQHIVGVRSCILRSRLPAARPLPRIQNTRLDPIIPPPATLGRRHGPAGAGPGSAEARLRPGKPGPNGFRDPWALSASFGSWLCRRSGQDSGVAARKRARLGAVSAVMVQAASRSNGRTSRSSRASSSSLARSRS